MENGFWFWHRGRIRRDHASFDAAHAINVSRIPVEFDSGSPISQNSTAPDHCTGHRTMLLSRHLGKTAAALN